MSNTRAARFNRIYFALVVSALALTLSINLIVDPFGLFGMPTWQGFNAEKTQYQKYLRMAKPHAVRLLKPRGLILGTSRAENVDPDHPGWHDEARPAYNMAIQSSRIHEVLRNLQHAQSQHRLKQVVLLLDDFMFDPRVRSEAGFDEARLDLDATSKQNGAWLSDLAMSLLSFDALLESIATVSHQKDKVPVIYLANGARDPARFQTAVDLKGGHRKLFLDQAKPPGREFIGNDSLPYEDFRALLDFCRKQNIDLRLLINPMHAHMLELYWVNGKWEKLENWKRRLARILEQEAIDSHAGQSFPLWDFADYNSITTEPVPALGDTTARMRWYWESSHYKSAVGQLMLDRVFAHPATELPFHRDFGVMLQRGNIEQHLLSVRERHSGYAAANATDIAEISAQVTSSLQRRELSIAGPSRSHAGASS